MNECRFEPDAAPILCFRCDKPTGEMGTCEDQSICSECRDYLKDIGMSEVDIASMVISVVSGEHKWRPHRERVYHLGQGDRTLCHARGGPHLIATSPGEVNCKRCLR